MAQKVWAGLDIGVETTSICVIDDFGEILQEESCQTELRCVHSRLKWLRRRRSATVVLETGTGVSLARGLRNFGYSVRIYEARQLSKFLRVRRNKTDAGDARGIAEAGRVGASLVSEVYLKSIEAQSLQSRLTMRRHLISERVSAVNLLCRQIELFGGHVRRSTRARNLRKHVTTELKKLFGVQTSPVVQDLRHLLDHCEQMVAYQLALDDELARLAQSNELCSRFMEIPGVGPICALTFYTAVGEPDRFKRSSDVGSYFGLTPKVHQSGMTMRLGRISRMGNRAVRHLLVQASIGFMRWSNPDCELRRWASTIEQRRGRAKAKVAVARKLAIVMLAMWKTGERYRKTTISAAR